MVFSSLVFLCAFLPIVLICYMLVPGIRTKNIFLICASLLFYAYGEPVYVFLMMGSILFNYIMGLAIGRENRAQKVFLVLAIVVNLGLLGVFKYSGFIISNINDLFGLNIHTPDIRLPIGISFFTFQAMSYIIDVFRNDVQCQKNLARVALYITLFPQLIAGPIVKYHDISQQIENRSLSLENMTLGIRRFIFGLSKKVLISNTVAVAADYIFSLDTGEINILSAWLGALAYLIQIYYDFSGYSDMAIGLGMMFGFTFKENFNYPYSAVSIRDFWRRWHISLSTWFKEYLYIPLGGNRKGRLRASFNKIVVFFCTGLWHGANWTFIIWGLYHGLFLMIEEFAPKLRAPKLLKHLYTIVVVCVGFVIFRADTLSQGFEIIKNMFTGFNVNSQTLSVFLEQLTPLFIVTLIIGAIFSFPITRSLKAKLQRSSSCAAVSDVSIYIISILLLGICILSLASGTYNPFIYFRF